MVTVSIETEEQKKKVMSGELALIITTKREGQLQNFEVTLTGIGDIQDLVSATVALNQSIQQHLQKVLIKMLENSPNYQCASPSEKMEILSKTFQRVQQLYKEAERNFQAEIPGDPLN